MGLIRRSPVRNLILAVILRQSLALRGENRAQQLQHPLEASAMQQDLILEEGEDPTRITVRSCSALVDRA